MKLCRVDYFLFDRELNNFRNVFGKNRHGLDREVHFVFEDGDEQYVSWVQHIHEPSRADPDFHLEISDKSFWKDECSILDMSADPMWAGLIDKNVALDWRGPQNTVLVISAQEECVYLDACGDFVRISREKPGSLS